MDASGAARVTLDDVIEALLELRRMYPGAGCAPVCCPLELEWPTYDQGKVYIGCELVRCELVRKLDDVDPKTATKH